ncbi:toll/interleukin-1 receptor domain-containing protein [Streptomyces sp. NPDC001978]|uniref:toll/interleukin-1 receptor domain-containing protein n=1 Tax=Streptomyces sp. NPDC001978 TaxID=3364627 RepID=UPI00367B0E73
MRDVFISHSARGDDYTSGVLKRLQERLAEKNFHPLVDQTDISPGAEWRPEIVDWLARCGAAVVLLNDKALTSDWVKREVNILMWRKALGARLLVVPVLLGDLSTGDVKKAGMEELRPIQFARTERGAPEDADDIADKVLEQFAQLPPDRGADDPMTAWLRRIDVYLSQAQRSDLLVDAAKALAIEGEHLAHVTAQQGGCLFLAHQFLVATPERMERALDALAPSLPHDTLRRLISALKATWVSEEAARRVLPDPEAEGPPQEMTILLNAGNRSTAEQYIKRATCGATLGFEVKSVGDLPIGEDRVGERFRIWEKTVWSEFFDAESEEDRILPDDLEARTHYLVINELRPPDAEFVQAVELLHRAFSWLVVLVTTGTSAPEPRIRSAFKNPILLQPLLTASAEKTASLRIKRLQELPERLAY